MKQLKLNFLSLFLGLKWTLLFVLGYYFVVFLIFRDLNIFKMWYVHIWPIINILLDIYIIAGYLLENFNKKIEIGNHYILDKNAKKKYDSDEILKIIIHKSEFLDSGKYAMMSFMHYKYAEILLKDNNKLILTSLMNANIDEFLKENLNGVYFQRDYNNFL
ncbi:MULTISPECIES: hypothetical protein [Chryseobacterium]|uniref:hypothetical protein n=1 Tax=Chryseobacterium sp. R2A-55 TaxID=2744445 RepID=UPI001F45D88C|nr:hypothetical protein [Chryseobacterium sp. R2A-55]